MKKQKQKQNNWFWHQSKLTKFCSKSEIRVLVVVWVSGWVWWWWCVQSFSCQIQLSLNHVRLIWCCVCHRNGRDLKSLCLHWLKPLLDTFKIKIRKIYALFCNFRNIQKINKFWIILNHFLRGTIQTHHLVLFGKNSQSQLTPHPLPKKMFDKFRAPPQPLDTL